MWSLGQSLKNKLEIYLRLRKLNMLTFGHFCWTSLSMLGHWSGHFRTVFHWDPNTAWNHFTEEAGLPRHTPDPKHHRKTGQIIPTTVSMCGPGWCWIHDRPASAPRGSRPVPPCPASNSNLNAMHLAIQVRECGTHNQMQQLPLLSHRELLAKPEG